VDGGTDEDAIDLDDVRTKHGSGLSGQGWKSGARTRARRRSLVAQLHRRASRFVRRMMAIGPAMGPSYRFKRRVAGCFADIRGYFSVIVQ
jgi:hypothetical protein